jgi:hypothetical protein
MFIIQANEHEFCTNFHEFKMIDFLVRASFKRSGAENAELRGEMFSFCHCIVFCKRLLISPFRHSSLRNFAFSAALRLILLNCCITWLRQKTAPSLTVALSLNGLFKHLRGL